MKMNSWKGAIKMADRIGRVSGRMGITLFLIVLLTVLLSSCQVLDTIVPTVIPPAIRGEAEASPAAADQSPRVRSAQDVPPTWTPQPNVRSETPIAAPQSVSTPQSGSQGTYTVQAGDTLAEIATRYNVTLDALAAANNIENYDHIEVGQVLVIP
jgi:LysM repeat protein